MSDRSPENRHAKEVLADIYVMLVGTEEPWTSMDYGERCARAANEAQQAFLFLEQNDEDPTEAGSPSA